MRERFELCTRVVGLVLVCGGLFLLCLAPEPYIAPGSSGSLGEMGEMMKRSLSASAVQAPLTSYMEEFERAAERQQLRTALFTALRGVIVAVLGLYLMRSNNLVVRLCYPQVDATVASKTSTDEASRLPTPATSDPNRPADADSARYAPPGYAS